MSFIFLIGCVALQVWAWRTVLRRLQGGTITRLQGALRYAGWAFLPVLLFVGGFAAMVGLEELTDAALIDERAALLAFPALALSVFSTVGFAIRSALVRRRPDTGS